jgi:hypothetical protein
MSAFERWGTRDLTFSRWHRQALRDFAGSEADGAACGMIDIDCLEYCARCGMNLFLVETAQDIRQAHKATTQMERLAGQANIPAYCVLYTPTGEDCPFDRRCRNPQCTHGIQSFRVRQVAPVESHWHDKTAKEFAVFVLDFHSMHEATVCKSKWLMTEWERP